MIRLTFCILFFFSSSALLHAWDADDETFDPTITETIIDGASRIGDPSPFYREGYEKRGFTYVGFTVPEKGDPTVNLSFIFPPNPDDPAKNLGGSLYLPAGKAKALIAAFEEGADLSGNFDILIGSWNGDWTLVFDKEKGLVVQQDYQDQIAKFSLSVPAAKKLAEALKHSLGKIEKGE